MGAVVSSELISLFTCAADSVCASGSASGACGAAGCGLVPVVDAASAVLACACSGSAVSGGDACGISAVAAGACWV